MAKHKKILDKLEIGDGVAKLKLMALKAIAFDHLLTEAEKSPVIIRYCGMSKNQESLWEVVNMAGKHIALQGTIEQVAQSLYDAKHS